MHRKVRVYVCAHMFASDVHCDECGLIGNAASTSHGILFSAINMFYAVRSVPYTSLQKFGCLRFSHQARFTRRCSNRALFDVIECCFFKLTVVWVCARVCVRVFLCVTDCQ